MYCCPLQAEESNPESCMARCCDFRNFKRSFLSALCYTAVTVAIAAIVWLVSYNYLANTHLPYKLTAVSGRRPWLSRFYFLFPTLCRFALPSLTQSRLLYTPSCFSAAFFNVRRWTCNRCRLPPLARPFRFCPRVPAPTPAPRGEARRG